MMEGGGMDCKRTFCGKSWSDMGEVLNTMCNLEDDIDLTDKENDCFNIAIQCITQIMNRMIDGKEINFD